MQQNYFAYVNSMESLNKLLDLDSDLQFSKGLKYATLLTENQKAFFHVNRLYVKKKNHKIMVSLKVRSFAFFFFFLSA